MAAARVAFLDFRRDHGAHHFRVEEEVLPPRWALHAEVDRPGVDRMLQEHPPPRPVRFEERRLFPAIEDSLNREQLAKLIPLVEEAELR